jgi:CO/xanthine dehydrogenase FAD-binding subunit
MNVHHTLLEFRAGGTDLSERHRSGVSRGKIVDLTPTDTVTSIAWGQDGAARIGAMVTIETLASDPRVRESYPGFAAAAAGLATPQIRRVGTLGGNLAQRSRCWYFRNPHFACLKKGGPVCLARAGNHLYGVAFDLGPCVAPHPSTLAAALLAYDATITTNERNGLTISELLGDGSDGTADNKLRPGEHITYVDMRAPLEDERRRLSSCHRPHLCRMAASGSGRARGLRGKAPRIRSHYRGWYCGGAVAFHRRRGGIAVFSSRRSKHPPSRRAVGEECQATFWHGL